MSILLALLAQAQGGFTFEILQVLGGAGMGLAISYLWIKDLQNRLKARDEELKELNAYLRQQDKENLETMNNVINVMDSLLENGKSMKTDIVKEVKDQASIIISHIQDRNGSQ